MENSELRGVVNDLLANYQVRKTKEQKYRFYDFVYDISGDLGWLCHLEEKFGLFFNRNIIVGNVSKAEVIFTAHYDTCAMMPFPNFITPKNIFVYLLYQIILVGLLFGIAFGIAHVIALIFGIANIKLIYEILFILMLFQLINGFPNKHTANDNTSGVATLLAIMHNLPDEYRSKVAFVFFDNEEVGMVGSSAFKKRHRKEIANKLVINFDCVSDGDHFLFVGKKEAVNSDEYPHFEDAIRSEAADTPTKKVEFTKASRVFYPSDQLLFRKSIAVAALKHSPILGLYMDRIHTPFDTRFDHTNIDFLSDSYIKFVSRLHV